MEAGASLLFLSILFGWTGVNVITGLSSIAVAALIGRSGWCVVEWQAADLYITDWRVLETSGVVTKRVATLPLSKITDLTYERTPLGRILGYGRLILETAGQDQALNRLDHLPHPHQLYEALSHLTLHGTDAPSPGANAIGSRGQEACDPARPRRVTRPEVTDDEHAWIDALFSEEGW